MFKIVGNSVKFNMLVSQGQRWKKSSKGIRLVTSICLLVRPENRWRTICRPLPSSPVLRFSCWAPYRFIFPQEKLAFFYCFTFSAEDRPGENLKDQWHENTIDGNQWRKNMSRLQRTREVQTLRVRRRWCIGDIINLFDLWGLWGHPYLLDNRFWE